MIKEESQLTKFHYKRLNKILNKKSAILSLQNHFKIELDKMKSDLVLIGSNVNQIRYLYGWPMVIFIFKHLFKNEFLNKNLIIKNDNVDINFSSLKLSENILEYKSIEVNAFQIYFDLKMNRFYWTHDFEDFITNNELKILQWTNPLQNLIIALKYNFYSTCYFDADHYIKVLRTILNTNRSLLKRIGVNSTLFENNCIEYLEDPSEELNKKFKSAGLNRANQSKTYYSETKAFFYVKPFLSDIGKLGTNTLPKLVFEYYFPKFIVLFSNQTKASYLNSFKELKGIYRKILFLYFLGKPIPEQFYSIFVKFCTVCPNNILKLSESKLEFEEFKFVMIGFNLADFAKSSRSTSRFFQNRNCLKELAAYGKDNNDIGPILKNYLGFIPNNQLILKDIHLFRGFEIKQIKSKAYLFSIGNEFRNCLRNNSHGYADILYHNNNRHFLIFRSIEDKKQKFILDFEVESKGVINKFALLGPSNSSVNQSNYDLVDDFLFSVGIAKIDLELMKDFYCKFILKIMNSDLNKGLDIMNEQGHLLVKLFNVLKKYPNHFPEFSDHHFKSSIRRISNNQERKIIEYLNSNLVA